MRISHCVSFVVLLSALLSGCVTPPQQAINLAPQTISSANGTIGVVMNTLPKVDTHFPGASCLLCLAAASIANSSLTTYVQTLSEADLASIRNEVVEAIQKKGAKVVNISEKINFDAIADASSTVPNSAKKDFSALKNKYSLDKLIVIDIRTVGVSRNYSAYIPTSDPKGVVFGSGYMVDLKTNTYDWYMPISIAKSSDNVWDEPPNFPGLTNAYFQAIEICKIDILNALVQ